MRTLFIDATADMTAVFHRVHRADDIAVDVRENPRVTADELPGLLDGYHIVLDDHSAFPTEAVARCPSLRHIVFLGTGASSYMNVEELAGLGVTVHTIRGYGDTAVAEHTMALLWAAARDVATQHEAVRRGGWPTTEGVQLTGKTIGLIGYGGIASEVARLARGIGMRVLAWNRTPRGDAGTDFVPLDTLLAESHVVSLHLGLTDDTRGFLSAERIARMRPGAILVNTARGALIDEAALIAALRMRHLRHAAMDVFDVEPLPHGHPLAALPNVTLTAHSGFSTPEAGEILLRRALDIAAAVSRPG